ncbi:tetratricopeptide repeat protein [Cronbergia sp. UHCC 0137]|uniref:O-linked N-acetylglucosamine transferase family protein n=1 Tax=Cronbergia sp. UHCC 0137 TaxID=3110239 RepID=UPI002B1F7AD3|nr:tetratricopeptide repeat protein [Cronbergia sp. UHCC 0137]MEA5617804.1 tetratricopeptide repeat protein [Cronbergia sp. UHCC 0137]
MGKKIISFSLWGNNPKYTVGALRNADLAGVIYPGWICRFYTGISVPQEIIDRLSSFPLVEIVKMDEVEDWRGSFWRFSAAADLDMEVVIFRDIDSRLTWREKAAVDEWLKSNHNFHIMRDHPGHFPPILPGMWGIKGNLLKNIEELIKNYLKASNQVSSSYGVDQYFLCEVIFPWITSQCIVHDEFFINKPFPQPRVNYEYVGQIFDQDDKPVTEFDSLLIEALNPKSNVEVSLEKQIHFQNKEKFSSLVFRGAKQLLNAKKYDLAIALIQEAIQCSQTPQIKEELFSILLPINSQLSHQTQVRNIANQATLNTLQKQRQIISQSWLSLPTESLINSYLGDIGKAHQKLLENKVNNQSLTSDEEIFVDQLVKAGFKHPQAIQNFLAVMLYLQPHQLPPLWYQDLTIPDWLINDYLKYIFTSPEMFQKIGEVDNYYQYFQKLLEYLVNKLQNNQNSKFWQDVVGYFTQNAKFIPIYFTNQPNLKDLYIHRSQLIESTLKNLGHFLDYKFPERPANRKKIRLGILNDHFTPQTETYVTIPVFEHLDRSQFEIILYAIKVTNHPLEEYCQSRVDKLVQLPNNLVGAVQTIRADNVDILFIGTNITAVSRPSTLLAIHRLGRVQVASLSSPVTTGMKTIDYYIAGNLTAPIQEDQAQYREKLLNLDGSGFCFRFPLPESPTTLKFTRENWGCTADSVIFISGANFYKIIPELREIWAKIIAAVPNSILVLYPFNPNWSSTYPKQQFKEEMYRVFAKHNIDKSRLIFIEPLENVADIKELLQPADIYLDSYPFAGVNSLLDPLKVGLPTVVMEGNGFRFRLASCLLRELKLPTQTSLSLTDLIAKNEAEYINLAINLGTNPQLREEYKQQIQQGMENNPVFLDSHFYSQQMGAIFQQLCQKSTKHGKIGNIPPAKGFGQKKVTKKLEKPNIPLLFTTAINFHHQQQFEQALIVYEQILKFDPNHVDSLNNLGTVLKNLGRIEEAIGYYRRVLNLKPNQAETWFNLGNTLQSVGKLEEAESAFQQVMKIEPKLGVAPFKLAKLLQEQEKFSQAADYYRQAIALMPTMAEAYTNLGNVLKALGELDQAIAQHQQALQLQPNYPEAHYNLGNTFLAQKQYLEAITAYKQAVELKPDLTQAHIRLGILLQQTEENTLAESHLRQALQLQPNEVEAFDQLIILLHKQGKSETAIALLQDKIQKFPDHVIAHSHLGTIYNDLGQFVKATFHLRRAVKLDPNLAIAYNHLGYALIHQGQLTQAIESCQQAIQINPDLGSGYVNMGFALNNQGRVEEAIVCFEEALRLDPNSHPGHSNLLYAMNYDGANSATAIANAHYYWGKHCTASISAHQSWSNSLKPERKLRIGYVSPDFRNHSVAYFIEPILTHHSDRKVRVFCYSNVPQPDAVTDRLRAIVQDWRDISHLNDQQVSELIQADQIDILVDLAGHTSNNRLPLFALKPAPIQVTYLGYPNTTGLDCIDYRLIDTYTDPIGLTDEYYTEKLIRLPHSFLCYQPSPTAPEVMDLPAKKEGYITFGSFNSLSKISSEVISLWSQILQAIPNSRIILKNLWFEDKPTRDRYLQMFADHGIEENRVKLIGLIPDSNDHLAFYGNIDIALDTFPYNGTTTTCEALWMGVPVITLEGETHTHRVGVSLLTSIGLPELIATICQDYVSIAVTLSTDLEKLSQLRSTLREKVANSPLCNALTHTRSIETAYRNMWRHYCQQGKS